jgi:hypothetical protein
MSKILLLALLLSLVGCSTPIAYYKNTTPQLKLEEFYNGKLTAYGIVQSRNGKVLRRFSVEMTGTWNGNKGVLDEHFVYDDGEKQQRIWYLEKKSDGQYTGSASDVVKAADGETQGYALEWKYTLAIKVDGTLWEVDFEDWMYLIDEHRLINRAQMSKWGFNVGEVTLYIEKQQ